MDPGKALLMAEAILRPVVPEDVPAVHSIPFLSGVLLMVMGGLLAALDRRYRRPSAAPMQTASEALSSAS